MQGHAILPAAADMHLAPKINRAGKKLIGALSFYFGFMGYIICACIMSYYKVSDRPTYRNLQCRESQKENTAPPRQGMMNLQRWCVYPSLFHFHQLDWMPVDALCFLEGDRGSQCAGIRFCSKPDANG